MRTEGLSAENWRCRRSGKPGLDTLAALAAGLIVDLGARVPYGRAPSRNQYTATARAVAALRRRGLVETETVGTRKGRMEWLRGADGKVTPRWRTTNPSKYVLVRVRVDSSKAVRYRFRSGVTRE